METERHVETESRKLDTAGIKRWLMDDVTVKLPGWVFAVGAVLILLIALD